METKQYSYETFPGQTIIKEVADGYSYNDLIDEIRNNGSGVIVADSDNESKLSIVGKQCSELDYICDCGEKLS
jgi:hypothetical protein